MTSTAVRPHPAAEAIASTTETHDVRATVASRPPSQGPHVRYSTHPTLPAIKTNQGPMRKRYAWEVLVAVLLVGIPGVVLAMVASQWNQSHAPAAPTSLLDNQTTLPISDIVLTLTTPDADGAITPDAPKRQIQLGTLAPGESLPLGAINLDYTGDTGSIPTQVRFQIGDTRYVRNLPPAVFADGSWHLHIHTDGEIVWTDIGHHW